MADTITSPFDPQMPFPIDIRMRRQSIAQRDTISEFIRWEGMMVYVIDDQTTYQLIGGIENSQWVALSIGTGPGNFIPLSWVQPSTDLDFNSDQKVPTSLAVANYIVDVITNDLPFLPIDRSIIRNGPNNNNSLDSITGSGLFSQTGGVSGTPDTPWDGSFGGMFLAGSTEGGVITKIGVGIGTGVIGEDDDNLWYQSRTGREWFRATSRQVFDNGAGFGLFYDESSETYNWSGYSTASELYSGYNISRNCGFNTSNEPKGALDFNDDIWFGGIGSRAEIYINKRSKEGFLLSRKIGDIRTSNNSEGGTNYALSDLHCGPGILVDTRPSPVYPIMVFQSDHSIPGQGPRVWRMTDTDLATWDISTWEDVPNAEESGYIQVFRFNDEIFLFTRIGTGGDPTRTWRLCYSSDNGDNWVTNDIFETDSPWLYISAIEKDDGSGLNISFWEHPAEPSANQDIAFLYLDFVSGEVINPSSGTPIIADIRAAVANPSFVTINPFNDGLIIYNAPAGTNSRNVQTGNMSTGNSMVTYILNDGTNWSIQSTIFSLTNGSILDTINIPSPDNMQINAGIILDINRIVWSNWIEELEEDSGKQYGQSYLYISDISDPININTIEMIYSNRRMAGMNMVSQTNVMLFVEWVYRHGEGDFYVDAYVHDFDNDNYVNPNPPPG